MDNSEALSRLEGKGVKATANRILVWQMLYKEHRPLSLTDLEALMPSMDKSSIFRTLSLFVERDVVHAFGDGRGIINYELCAAHGECTHTDNHVHFYCELCQRTFCLEHSPAVLPLLPEGFTAHTFAFVIKGECAECKKRHRHNSL